MDHKTFDELHRLLEEAGTNVTVGAKYYHYKDQNEFYVVKGLSVLEATDEIAVKYSPISKP